MKVNPALNRLRIQPFAPGINRDELVSQVEEALENPDKVDQGLHPHMCVPAVLQSYLAQTDPEEFVELVGELASPEGVAETASGLNSFSPLACSSLPRNSRHDAQGHSRRKPSSP